MFVECRYDDLSHSIELSDPISSVKRTLTSLSKPNKLFSIRANSGYNSFFCHAVDSGPEWCSFAGALHVIPPDDDASAAKKTIETGKTRETDLSSNKEGGEFGK